MDFSLIGIIAGISHVLAYQEISIFLVSTFRTDSILVKTRQLAIALPSLTAAGYKFV